MSTLLSFLNEYWQGLTVLSLCLSGAYKLISNHLAHHKIDIIKEVKMFRADTNIRFDKVDKRLDRLEEPYFKGMIKPHE